MKIDHIKNGRSHFDWKQLDQYFPCYGVVMSLVKIPRFITLSWQLFLIESTGFHVELSTHGVHEDVWVNVKCSNVDCVYFSFSFSIYLFAF